MSKYALLPDEAEPPSQGHCLWRVLWRVLAVVMFLLILGIWALIGPLPNRMMQARHNWLNAPDDPHPQYFFDSAHGTLVSKGASGDWTLYASDCLSGQARSYYGVSLTDRTNAQLAARIVQPEFGGDHITVKNPDNGQETTFTRQQCSQWDVDMHYDGTTANTIKELAGHARFDCSAPNEHIVGNFELRACH